MLGCGCRNITFHVRTLYILCAAVPIATFVLGPCSTEHAQFFQEVGPDGGELCPNMTCLGKSITVASGFYLGF